MALTSPTQAFLQFSKFQLMFLLLCDCCRVCLSHPPQSFLVSVDIGLSALMRWPPVCIEALGPRVGSERGEATGVAESRSPGPQLSLGHSRNVDPWSQGEATEGFRVGGLDLTLRMADSVAVTREPIRCGNRLLSCLLWPLPTRSLP